MKNIGDYHDHYLKKEKFIDNWEAMLKMTDVKFKNIFDIYMHLLIEKGLTRGISYIAKRYSKSNNKYIKNYDSKNPSKFITYLDMNDLYGWAMSGYLPYGRFKWLKSVDGFDVNSISEKSSIVYILEVVLESPVDLHA